MTSVGTKTRRGEATKERILQVARSLVEEGGYANLRMTTLCERASTAPTSVYWHFGNKAGLVQAIMESAFEPLGRSILDASKTESLPRKKIDVFVDHLRSLATDRPFGALSMLAFLREDGEEIEGLREGLVETRQKELALQISELKQSMELTHKAARQLALTINACANYAALVHLTGGSQKEIEQIFDVIRQRMIELADV